MSRKRKVYGAAFKSKVVLEVLESGKTVNEIASKYELLPKNIINWKKHFLDNMSLAFDKSAVVKEYKDEISEMKKEIDTFAKTLGKIVIERDWAVEKLKSLDLSSKRNMLKNSEALQAQNKSEKPSQNRQLEMFGMSKTAFYYHPTTPFSSERDKKLLDLINGIYTKCPFYGHRRVTEQLLRDDFFVGRKHVSTAMKFLGLKALYPQPKTTIANKQHEKYPYLLGKFKNSKNQVIITTPNKVWSTDITYIKLEYGFVYLASIIDWNSKKILSWKLSNTMDVSLTTSVLKEALAKYPKPEIFNSDQGSQYTANEHVKILKDNNILISMDGKGRSIDNIVIERFWRTLKYEDIYLNSYSNFIEAREGIDRFMSFYNNERLHSKIDYATPNEIYYKKLKNKESIRKMGA